MPLTARSLGLEDVTVAVELLAARHGRDRLRQPLLPTRYESPANCLPLLEALLADGAGVVAERDGRLVGYLMAECTAPDRQQRRAFIPLEGHAIAADEDGETYRQMYAALAPTLIRRGLFDHQVLLPAGDAEAVEAWFSLTFGQGLNVAVRPVGKIDAAPTEIEVRHCGERDLETVVEMFMGLEAFHTSAPVFRPSMETPDSLRREIADDVASRDSLVLLALLGGRAAGMFIARPPRTMLMGRFDRTLAVLEVYTRPDARRRGVAAAMLAEATAWAGQRGFEHLALDYMTANPLSSRFWRVQGFEPVATILQRRIDPRVAWADGSNE